MHTVCTMKIVWQKLEIHPIYKQSVFVINSNLIADTRIAGRSSLLMKQDKSRQNPVFLLIYSLVIKDLNGRSITSAQVRPSLSLVCKLRKEKALSGNTTALKVCPVASSYYSLLETWSQFDSQY